MKRRTVITGIGAISPNGIGKEAFWKALEEGKSGVGEITAFDATSYPTRIAGEVQDFDPMDYMPPRSVRRISRAAHFAVATAGMAVSDSQLRIEEEDEVSVGIGVTASAMDIVEVQHSLFMERGVSRVSPFGVKAVVPSSSASSISSLLGCRGTVITISNSCPAGLDAIGYAFGEISHDRENVFIAGGTDAQITPFGLALLCALRIMSTRNDAPEQASRPFDRTRDGGILSEGAGVLILEEMGHALSRGAYIYGEILGYASKSDSVGTHEVETPGIGIERTMHLALQAAGIEPREVDYICAHAPSDEFDGIETTAIKRVFGEYAYKLPVSSIKSMIGNPLAAAGPLQVIAAVMVFERNVIPPTINYEYPDPDCDLDYVPWKARKCDGIKIILINSHGFGGSNSSLVLRRYTQVKGESNGRK